jgi:hypothetical protein
MNGRKKDTSLSSSPSTATGGGGGGRHVAVSDEQKRIKHLEKQMDHLERLLKKKDPTNVNQLLRAVRSDAHEEEVTSLQLRVKELEQLVIPSLLCSVCVI